MPFRSDRVTNNSDYLFSIRPLPRRLPSLGYFRTKNSRATVVVVENMAEQFAKSKATMRVWHTRRLWITWETPPK